MRRFLPAVCALAVAITLLAVPDEPPETEQVNTFTAASVSTAHPYSDPEWFPLRTSALNEWANPSKPAGNWAARMGCSMGNPNCPDHNGKDYHPYWALDFYGDAGDPVYAAGAGKVYIPPPGLDCHTKSDGTKQGSDGQWVWIDHGGGRTSRYYHLGSVVSTLQNGDLVDPTTKIGTVGHSGSCATSLNYLHFAVLQDGNLIAHHINPGPLRACKTTNEEFLYPRDIRMALDRAEGPPAPTWPDQPAGYTSWTQPVSGWDLFPHSVNACIPDTPPTPDQLAQPRGRFGDQSATVLWDAPSRPSTKVTVLMERWSQALSTWVQPTYRHLDASYRSTKFTGLNNGNQYRFRVAYRNDAGYAAWSPIRYITPGAVPDAPIAPRNTPINRSRYKIYYSWYRAQDNGLALTNYTVAIRRKTSSSWTTWTTRKVSPSALAYVWEGLTPNRTYGLRVRAVNAAGPGLWSTISSVTTDR